MRKYRIQDYKGKDYASLWKSRKRKYLDKVEKYIINRIVQPSYDKSVIDLGCGFGRLCKTYLYKYKKVILFDYSRMLLMQAAERIGQINNVTFIQGDSYNLPFKDNSFDTILMMRLFHHLEEPEQVISEVRRILRKKGNFLFTFYNKYDFRNRCKSFFCLGPANLSKLKHENVSKDQLLYISDPIYVKQALRRHDFDIRGYYGVNSFLGWLLKYNRSLGGIEEYLYKFLGRFHLTTEILVHASLKKMPESC